MSKAAPVAFSAWAWCWHRRSDPVSAAFLQLHAGPTTPALLLLAGAVTSLIGFVAWQRRLGRALALGGDAPLMNLALFDHRAFAMGSMAAARHPAKD